MSANPCSFIERLSGRGTPYVDLCRDGARAFNSEVLPVIRIRQEMGASRLRTATTSSINKLKQELGRASSLIEEKYRENLEDCKEHNDVECCGFVARHDLFVKTLGPLASFENNTEPSFAVKIAPLKSGYLVSDIDLQGKTLGTLFDTGCSVSLFSKKYVESHSENFTRLGHAADFNLPAFLVKNLTFKLGDINFAPNLAVYSPLVDFVEGATQDKPLVTLMGLDFLLQRSFKIDYDNSQIVFNAAIGAELAEKKWTGIPLTFGGSDSFGIGVEVMLNGQPIRMILDTGSNAVELYDECLPLLPNAKITDGWKTMRADGKTYPDKKMTNVDMIFGQHRTSLFQINISSDNQLLIAAGYCGTLGLDVIKLFNSIMDPNTFTLYVSPRTSKTYAHKLWDFCAERSKDGFIANAIKPLGKADAAGLKQGDILLKINGTNITGLTVLQVIDLAYTDAKRFTILISRKGEKKTVVIDAD